MATICTDCGGKGRKRIGFFRTKACGTCNGKGYVRSKPVPDQPHSFSDTRNHADDGITRVDLESMANRQHREEFSGQGGTFGGAGASSHWEDSHGSTRSSSDSSSSSSDSSGGGSGDSGGGGGD